MLAEALLKQPTRAMGGRPRLAGRNRLVRANAGPGSPVSMAAQAPRAAGRPEPRASSRAGLLVATSLACSWLTGRNLLLAHRQEW